MKTKIENTELPPILARLQQFVEAMHLTIYQVNKEAGLCKGLLINTYTKKQGLSSSTLEAILTAYPILNANWLIVGRGSMLNDEKQVDAERRQTELSRTHLDHLDNLQQQCVQMIKDIQQMKLQEQASADAHLLEQLLGQ